jgi:putative ABC transport system substrate-binding protein
MNRRSFVRATAGSLVFVSLAVKAQAEAQVGQTAKIARIGYLITPPLESPEARALLDALRQGLRERGYVEGRNIIIEVRAADGKVERFPRLASELVRLKLDLIVAANTPAARGVRQATSTVPIVVPIMGDPVGDSLVTTLAKPGGNITGSTFLGPELVPKRLQLLKEMLPQASRVAALLHPGAFSERTTSEMLNETEGEARALGLQFQVVRVNGPEDFDGGFLNMVRERANALIVFPGAMLFTERRRIVDLAAMHRLPSIYSAREFVEAGGLISYGASINDLIRRAGTYVDKILKGVKPGDLPVEQPTKFELVINLKTAKTLGLTISQSLLLRADQVIQ